MKSIWKFPITLDTRQIKIPKGSQVIHAGLQNDEVTLWAIVETEAPLETLAVLVTGTGHSMPNGMWRHVGTILTLDYTLVLHVFVGMSAGETPVHRL